MLYAYEVPTEMVQLSKKREKSLQYWVILRYLFWLSKFNNLIFRCHKYPSWCRAGYRSYCGAAQHNCRTKCYWDSPKEGWTGNWKDSKLPCHMSYNHNHCRSAVECLIMKNFGCHTYRRMSSVTCSEYWLELNHTNQVNRFLDDL